MPIIHYEDLDFYEKKTFKDKVLFYISNNNRDVKEFYIIFNYFNRIFLSNLSEREKSEFLLLKNIMLLIKPLDDDEIITKLDSSSKHSKSLVLTVFSNPMITHQELADKLSVSKNYLVEIVKKLISLKLIDFHKKGNLKKYFLTDYAIFLIKKGAI